jgi:hypothetical protein
MLMLGLNGIAMVTGGILFRRVDEWGDKSIYSH